MSYRMLRGAGILTWSCPSRPPMLLRELHFAFLCKRADAGWEGARAVKRRPYEGIHGSKRQTLSSSFCDYQQASFQHRQSISHHQVSTSAKIQLAFESLKCTVVEDLGQDLKALRIYWDSLINTTRLQPWRRSLDVSQLSLHNRTQCNFQSLYHRQHFVRPFSLSTHQLWILNHFQCRRQPSFHQTRAVNQAAPDVADAWRDCLSAQNENRCRQSLRPNLKLYEADEGRQGVSHSQGKSQAKWASILVSLCSVKGEPSFLFTLRSSTLKGSHKGDVSFAGGKRDPADIDVVATALREAREELGVNVGTERVWGILKPLRDRSGMMVAPVLANLGPLEELSFKPNPGEVEEIFTLSLSHLCNPQNHGYTHFRTGDKYGYTLPVFRNGRHRVWGLTAVALSHTLNLIVSS